MQNASPHEIQQWLNLVRLSDASIRSFTSAALHLADYRENGHSGKVSGFYLAVDELEVAVGTTYRAVLATDALHAAVGRSLRQPTARQRELLRLTRNRIAHIDEKVAARQRSAQLEMHFLLPTPTGMEIDGRRLSYRDLTSVMRKTHANVELIRQTPSR